MSQTFDRAYDARGREVGASGRFQGRAFDGNGNFTSAMIAFDNTGAFLENELQRMDYKMHMPLMNTTWDRDLPLRSDVTMADEFSAFTVSTFGGAGGLGTGNLVGNGKHWINKNSTAISGVNVDIGQIVHPLREWGIENAYSIFSIESSAKIGRPIDAQKFEALKRTHELEADEQAYIGDIPNGDAGLITQASSVVSPVNVVAGNSGQTAWSTKTPQEILQDVNTAVVGAWTASAYAIMPRKVLIPPVQYGAISTALISNAGNQSILKYLRQNSIVMEKEGRELEILPCKWCAGAGVGGTITVPGIDRMVVYTDDEDLIRFPYVPMQRTPVEFRGLFHITNYYGKMGVVEVVYPQTVYYADGI